MARISGILLITYKFSSFVVHKFEIIIQVDLFYAEWDSWEAELACDVHPADLHIHCDDLHGPHAPMNEEYIQITYPKRTVFILAR